MGRRENGRMAARFEPLTYTSSIDVKPLGPPGAGGNKRVRISMWRFTCDLVSLTINFKPNFLHVLLTLQFSDVTSTQLTVLYSKIKMLTAEKAREAHNKNH